MRRIFKIFLFIIFSINIWAEPILLASFNAMKLGENEKDWISMAKIVSKFDIVSIQEVMNEKGLNKLREEVKKYTNEEWGYLISDVPVGSREYKEYFGILYKKNKVNKIISLGTYQDGKSGYFIREPFGALIKSNNFDFVVVSIHSIYGKDKVEREIEASRYHKVYKYFLDKSKEEDIILLGDFNLPANSKAFRYFKDTFKVKEALNPNSNKTTMSDRGLANSYDNAFFNRNNLKEYTGRFGVYNYTKNNYEQVRKYISDHLVIFMEFENEGDLDDK
ncbi:endonuclease/exonuclease/phosphatase family protein [Streptobacillus felis]|uniref:Endonuclease/exonuclease/phosphatase family protein n=1 Tax=Streptobacillus felis TaxID=1384509 RepID=A0A7Z0PE24_9FUSO|nr:endonuclease/exonuclease/phosphatase family protein [Streptobacillus felis]NYV27314.1 endonuclease/exonuclease/phosphatase family protein [Streptobacillus felis]